MTTERAGENLQDRFESDHWSPNPSYSIPTFRWKKLHKALVLFALKKQKHQKLMLYLMIDLGQIQTVKRYLCHEAGD